MKKSYEYQYGYARTHADEAYNPEKRLRKARKTIAVLAAHAERVGGSSAEETLLDVGASAGFLTRSYAKHYRAVYGIDIDAEALAYAEKNNFAENLHYIAGDSMSLPFQDESFDAVTCSQVYEHVPDAEQLIREIYRVLKPGGVCYFSAGNRFVLMEMHYKLPLLAAIPKPLAHWYLRLSGKGDYYYENHRSLWGLRRLVRHFEITDYTLDVIRDPDQFALQDIVQSHSFKQKIALVLLRFFYWLCPTYIWILTKVPQSPPK